VAVIDLHSLRILGSLGLAVRADAVVLRCSFQEHAFRVLQLSGLHGAALPPSPPPRPPYELKIRSAHSDVEVVRSSG
jgi:hypothetical protein